MEKSHSIIYGQKGGAVVNEKKCRKFEDNISKCNLIDLGTEGPKGIQRGPVTQFATRLFEKHDLWSKQKSLIVAYVT